MEEEVTDISTAEFAELMAGDRRLLDELSQGQRICAVTPFRYPGRRGQVMAYLASSPPKAGEPQRVIISDGGGLIKSLDEQGFDLAVDMIVSKTVFHAVKDVKGANIGSGELYIESNMADLPADLWRYLQLMAELVGLRHSKYKDALLQMSRHSERQPDLINW
jgi:hypothetical protein